MLITDPSNPEYYSPENQARLYQRRNRGGDGGGGRG